MVFVVTMDSKETPWQELPMMSRAVGLHPQKDRGCSRQQQLCPCGSAKEKQVMHSGTSVLDFINVNTNGKNTSDYNETYR